MATSFDPELPDSLERLHSVSDPANPLVIADLGDKLGASGSNWSSKHLDVLRLLKVAESWHKPFLPPLRFEHDTACPICHRDRSSSQEVDHEVDHDVVNRLRKSVHGLGTKSESSIYRLPEGPFRLALAKLIRSDFRDPQRRYPPRERTSTTHPQQVPSSSIPFPESSSPTRPASSEYSGSRASVPLDDDQNDARARKPEQLVTSLAKELFSVCLYAVLNQPDSKKEYCYRLESHISTALIGGTDVSSADDGGLCEKRLESSSWITIHPSLIMGECKPAAQELRFNDRTKRYFPILSAKALAQLFGEAVISWKQYIDTNFFHDGVYSYICNGTFIRFFHFEFGRYYAAYLDAPTKEDQLKLVRDYPQETCARVSSTRWYDLEEGKDVISTVCHVLSRLRLEEAREAGRQRVQHRRSISLTTDEMDTSYTSSDSDYSPGT